MNRVSAPSSRWTLLLATAGFLAIAIAQSTNMILARFNAGEVPPFSLALFRWLIVALGLLPFVASELAAKRATLTRETGPILAAGFLGMFLCGGPVYLAGRSTTAINIGLIMALSPVVVLIAAWLLRQQTISRGQIVGVGLALAGAVLIITRGEAALPRLALDGDVAVLVGMLGWSGYTLVQTKAAGDLSFLSRVCVFATAGALFSLPIAGFEMLEAPERAFSLHACAFYLFAGIVPGILAYAGFAYLGGRFGSVRASLVMYVTPIASVLLSFAVLGEPPHMLQMVGGGLVLVGVWVSLNK
jgi:drug/metabolite transporter (DMT)-like permease